MADPVCICEFPPDCDGSGVVHCEGCGGDFYCCLACMGNGESECDGCVACCGGDDERQGWDPVDDDQVNFQVGPEPLPEDE